MDRLLRLYLFSLSILFSFILSAPPTLADYAAGVAAFNRGSYASAQLALHRAAEAGDRKAQVMLGFMLCHGRGVPADPVQAADWLRRAANQGSVIAQIALARLYEAGDEVPRDLGLAYRRYGEALAHLGPSRLQDAAAAGRDRVALAISDAQLATLRQVAAPDLPPAPPLPLSAPDPALTGVAAIGTRFAPAARPAVRFADRHLVVEVQRALADLGYAPGKADGLAGPKTRAALGTLLIDLNWPSDTRIDEILVTELIMLRRIVEGVSRPEPTAPDAKAVAAFVASGAEALDARLRTLERLVNEVTGSAAVHHGFRQLDAWEAETRQVLTAEFSATQAEAFARREDGMVLGDVYGNFRRRAQSARVFLFSLREALDQRPGEFYAARLPEG